MSTQNTRIRHFLYETCQQERHKNCFEWGSLRIHIDPDSPQKGIEFEENVMVSIYDPNSDTIMHFTVPVDQVQFDENALTDLL